MTTPNTFHLQGGLLVPTAFGYNATEDKGRRQSPSVRVKSEDEVLPARKRRKLLATVQDQTRNHSLVAWMIRKHLDYVSSFHISFRTDQDPLDKLVNRIFEWHGAPRNFDYLGKFGRNEMFRMFEMEKVTGGDAGLLKLDKLKMQAIESDLIAKGQLPEGAHKKLKAAWDKVNDSGVVVDKGGRVTDYAIARRGKNGAKPIFDHLEQRDSLSFDGYWTRFSSQFRGVSPLSTALNAVQDISEAFEFNLLKAKMHALFGVAVMRNSPDTGNWGGAGGATSETTGATATASGTTLDLNPRTVNVLDLVQGDDVRTFESNTPSSQFVEGSYLFIQVAMLALDIPITTFDSRRSSFSARIADLNEYEVSSKYKRDKNRHVRKDYSDWVLSEIWNTPDSPWPLVSVAKTAGMQLRDVQDAVEWIPSGSPWLDKLRQAKGDELAISMMLDNSIDAARKRGGNVFTNIDKQAIVNAYAKSKGVSMAAVTTAQRTAEELQEDVEADAAPAGEQ